MKSVLALLLRAASLLVCMVLIAALVAGCGGGSSATPAPTPTPTPSPTPGTTATQVRLGDAAVDSIIDFEFSIGSPVVFTLSGATGAVSITVGPNRFELSHMAAKMEALDVLNVPQGSYVSAQITVQNPELTFVSPTGTPVTISGSTQNVIIPLNPPLTIGSAPAVVNIDVNLANSIVAPDGSITGINFTPSSFSFSTKAVATEAEQQDDSGEVEGAIGHVSSINGSNFTLDLAGSNSQLTFATDNTTEFKDGLTNLASALNQVVKVEGITRPDGSLFAKEVEGIEGPNGSELDGVLTLVTGNPATSLTLLAQDGIGNGMDPVKMGATFTVDVTALSANKYLVDQEKCDFSGMTVPGATFPFDATTIHAGQRVEIDNASGVPAINGTLTADKVKLEQQAFSGTVSNFSAGTNGAATFDVTLPVDSHLAILSGQTVVHVFQQPATNNRFGPIANNSVVRVRGLLFWTGTGFNMIARRITAP